MILAEEIVALLQPLVAPTCAACPKGDLHSPPPRSTYVHAFHHGVHIYTHYVSTAPALYLNLSLQLSTPYNTSL